MNWTDTMPGLPCSRHRRRFIITNVQLSNDNFKKERKEKLVTGTRWGPVSRTDCLTDCRMYDNFDTEFDFWTEIQV